MYVIGIDPGTTTGVAVWDTDKRRFITIESGNVVGMQARVLKWAQPELSNNAFLRIEDARLRKWYGDDDADKKQGAGSVKRDSAIWEEFCKCHKLNYEMVHPIKGGTKWDAKRFKRLTGWIGRTNQNARDAAIMVFQYTPKMIEVTR